MYFYYYVLYNIKYNMLLSLGVFKAYSKPVVMYNMFCT